MTVTNPNTTAAAHQISLHRPVSERYTVAVDIDGPLYELVPRLRDRVHRTTGRELHTLPEPNIYDLARAWGLGPNDIVQHLTDGVREGDIFWEGEPHLPGIEGLHILKEHGYRVVLVTARDLPGVEDLCAAATRAWLASVGAVYDELHVTSNKNAIDYDFLYDDYEKNVRSAHAAGREAVLQRRGWNVSVDLPQADWAELPELIAEAAARREAATRRQR